MAHLFSSPLTCKAAKQRGEAGWGCPQAPPVSFPLLSTVPDGSRAGLRPVVRACLRPASWAGVPVPVLDACSGGPVFFVVSVAFLGLWRVGRVWGTLGVSGCPVGGRLKGGEVLPWERKKRFVRA
ncbi:hypothetical protein GCM10010842_24540 [Deinococcus daejeonensis]|uniref:Uncharacterized protein n=1 Tax=Deinococcus daejeonensis TaxID=1007098 RepID=A0ABQ2J4M0_9DEIO|nr:hypothetical protein GCM10010842_24540 [Deinococcus daejeonensis]